MAEEVADKGFASMLIDWNDCPLNDLTNDLQNKDIDMLIHENDPFTNHDPLVGLAGIELPCETWRMGAEMIMFNVSVKGLLQVWLGTTTKYVTVFNLNNRQANNCFIVTYTSTYTYCNYLG